MRKIVLFFYKIKCIWKKSAWGWQKGGGWFCACYLYQSLSFAKRKFICENDYCQNDQNLKSQLLMSDSIIVHVCVCAPVCMCVCMCACMCIKFSPFSLRTGVFPISCIQKMFWYVAAINYDLLLLMSCLKAVVKFQSDLLETSTRILKLFLSIKTDISQHPES